MISEEFKKLKDGKITPWVFFNTDEMPVITNFYGKSIHYQGVEFEGSPRLIFWDGFVRNGGDTCPHLTINIQHP